MVIDKMMNVMDTYYANMKISLGITDAPENNDEELKLEQVI